MTGPIPSTDAWPPGSSPFSRRFRDLINSIAEAASWVLENQGDLEDLLIGEEALPEGPEPLVLLFALVTSSFMYADNRWEYSWIQSEFVPSTREWQFVPNGLRSADEGETIALNLAEVKNRANQAAHGVFLGPPEVPNAVGVVRAIPSGTPILLHLVPLPEETELDTNFRAFTEPNAINFSCN